MDNLLKPPAVSQLRTLVLPACMSSIIDDCLGLFQTDLLHAGMH